ncbi:MAG TPA: hypothetical protein GXX65_02460 [Methanosarcina sp.]|nr:hypothetical protein [Methanosarcina sp.]MDD4522068.1 hypothetical protein [Methanosarcina sp.]HHV23437.1 hypothetical protein [Methanosarcina sp.]
MNARTLTRPGSESGAFTCLLDALRRKCRVIIFIPAFGRCDKKLYYELRPYATFSI